MVITPHLLVGAAIGKRVRSVWLVFVLAWLSHYLLDFLPHWDYLSDINIANLDHLTKIGLDFLLGLSLVYLLVYPCSKKFPIFVGAIAAILPDCLNVAYHIFGLQFLKPLVWVHHTAHHWHSFSFLQGLPAALTVCLIAIFVLLYLRRKEISKSAEKV